MFPGEDRGPLAGTGGISRVWGALRSAVRLRFASLPTRIIVSVFAAALVTGLAVAAIATRSTESFLRSKIDERFAKLLADNVERLDRWYDQREQDLETFASSETVADSLTAERRPELARQEARKYLSYVREGFPQYRGLYVLEPDGALHVSVGADLGLAVARRLEVGEGAPEVGPVHREAGERFQVISAPVSRGGRRLGTLHAVVGLDSIDALLGAEDLDATVGVYVVGPQGAVLAAGPMSPARERYEGELPGTDGSRAVASYATLRGAPVVGSAMRFSRFGWTLVVEQDYDVAFAPVLGVLRKVFVTNLGVVVLFGLIAFTMARSIVRPIKALSEGARRIAEGDTDVAIPLVEGQDEIGVLSRALHEMVERLRRNQVELQRKQDEIERANADLTRMNEDLRRGNEMLEQLSFTDGLTKLHNHRYFQDQLRSEARRSDRSGEPLALLLVDIDDFKSLNDQFGHAAGDEVLRRVAVVVNNVVRETDLPARYGGEEFAVLAPGTDARGAIALAEKLRRSVSSSRFRGEGIAAGEGLSVTVSVGAALYAGDPKRFFNEADRALYRAKADGKDCVVLGGD